MKIKGFTLLELVIIMLILSGLALISISSFGYLRSRNEQQTLIDEIKAVVQYAKIQAVSLGHPVVLTPSLDWSNGIILSHYNKITNQSERLYQWKWHHRHWSMAWSGANSSNKIMFSSSSMSSMSNGSFILTHRDTHEKIVIFLNRLGRVRVEVNSISI